MSSPEERILVELTRRGGAWRAVAGAVDPRGPGLDFTRLAAADEDGPAAALETVGQELDRREWVRVSREAGIPTAADRELFGRIAIVLEVLEARESARTDELAHELDLSVEDTLEALEQAETDGVVDHIGVSTWRLTRRPELEL